MKIPPPDLTLEIRPSRLLGRFILVTHLAASGMLPLLAQRHAAFWLLLVPILVSFVHAWRRHQSGTARLVVPSSGECLLAEEDGPPRPVALLPHSRIWPALMVLNLRLEGGGRRSLILLPDNTDPEQRRRLRVRLMNGWRMVGFS